MRYIDADALVKRLKHSPLFLGTNMQFKDGVVDLVEKQPTADVEEVRHGEWIMTDSRFAEMSCSICGFKYYGEYDKECMSNYCPDCGAKMDGERKEK